jgi:hypothetical protein
MSPTSSGRGKGGGKELMGLQLGLKWYWHERGDRKEEITFRTAALACIDACPAGEGMVILVGYYFLGTKNRFNHS